jgi:hypothetical protein
MLGVEHLKEILSKIKKNFLLQECYSASTTLFSRKKTFIKNAKKYQKMVNKKP